MITLEMYTLNIILLVGKENSIEAAFHKRTGRMPRVLISEGMANQGEGSLEGLEP